MERQRFNEKISRNGTKKTSHYLASVLQADSNDERFLFVGWKILEFFINRVDYLRIVRRIERQLFINFQSFIKLLEPYDNRVVISSCLELIYGKLVELQSFRRGITRVFYSAARCQSI